MREPCEFHSVIDILIQLEVYVCDSTKKTGQPSSIERYIIIKKDILASAQSILCIIYYTLGINIIILGIVLNYNC